MIGIKAIHVAATIILQFILLMNVLYLMGNTRATYLSIVRGTSTGIADILKRQAISQILGREILD